MGIENTVDLLLRQPLSLEDIHQGLESDITRRFIDDFDDPGAGWAGTADKSRSRAAIGTSHTANVPY